MALCKEEWILLVGELAPLLGELTLSEEVFVPLVRGFALLEEEWALSVGELALLVGELDPLGEELALF